MEVNTFYSTISIPQEKKSRLASYLEDLFDRRESTLTDLASLRRSVKHYSACLPYVRPFVALFSQVRRETFASVRALEAASPEIDLFGAAVILRNDAVAAMSALHKRSFSSTS